MKRVPRFNFRDTIIIRNHFVASCFDAKGRYPHLNLAKALLFALDMVWFFK